MSGTLLMVSNCPRSTARASGRCSSSARLATVPARGTEAPSAYSSGYSAGTRYLYNHFKRSSLMRNLCLAAVLVCTAVPEAFGQLTPDQKVADFMQLAGLYAKNYAPYEWKRDVIGFDLYTVKPWLDQVKQTKSDLEFYDVCVRYVAALQDSHDEFTLPTDFEAWAHLGVDIYDGKVLIDGIDRSYLPSKTYTFQVGDEIVSIDGKGVQDWITALQPYAVNGSANPVSRQRLAINLALDRLQSWWPMAVPSGDSVTLVVRSQKHATNSTFTLPSTISCTPF